MSTTLVKVLAASLVLFASAALAELRVVHDAARNRTWVLESDGVYLQEGGLKKRFALPGWMYVKEAYACAPALAIDAQGAAVVSSNVVSRLWRIDPVASRVTSHDPVLDADADKDVGFTGLTFAADQGVFYASSVHGSLWRIDPQLRRAQKISLSAPLEGACALAVERTRVRRSVVLSAQRDTTVQAVYLAPDQRSGYVRKGE
jgi:hypothetical protein